MNQLRAAFGSTLYIIMNTGRKYSKKVILLKTIISLVYELFEFDKYCTLINDIVVGKADVFYLTYTFGFQDILHFHCF